jgi:4-hydroxybenzoyl-CoA thioesterase
MRERGLGPPTVRLECGFERPGLHGDELEWRFVVARIGRSSADIYYVVRARGERLWSARPTIVLTDLSTSKATPWPAGIRAGLSKFMETSQCR